jgi:hypothetical protein
MEGIKTKKEVISDLFYPTLPLLGFPISLRYIGIDFSPNRVHKKTRFAVANRVFFAPLFDERCSYNAMIEFITIRKLKG